MRATRQPPRRAGPAPPAGAAPPPPRPASPHRPDPTARAESPPRAAREIGPSRVRPGTPPSAVANLRAFHSARLWLAVTAIPPAAPASRTAIMSVGVGTMPMSTTSHATDTSPAPAAAASMGPEVRESRPRITDRPSALGAQECAVRRGKRGDQFGRERISHPAPEARDAHHEIGRKNDWHAWRTSLVVGGTRPAPRRFRRSGGFIHGLLHSGL